MNKREKETAAVYLSSCLYDMKYYTDIENEWKKKRAEEQYKEYIKKLRELLNLKFDLFCLDYEKSVIKTLKEIGDITMVFYSQRVNGQQLKYPA